MTDLVPRGDIERIVGVSRHPTKHYARAVSATQTVYILHSAECLDSGRDLRSCRYSIALDAGIEEQAWGQHCDQPIEIRISETRLVPAEYRVSADIIDRVLDETTVKEFGRSMDWADGWDAAMDRIRAVIEGKNEQSDERWADEYIHAYGAAGILVCDRQTGGGISRHVHGYTGLPRRSTTRDSAVTCPDCRARIDADRILDRGPK